MYILGISCYYHDSAACLLEDGKIIAAAEEERFTRKKHDKNFPENAIEFCLTEAEINSNDLDCVVFHEKPIVKFERILQTFTETFPKGFRYFYNSIPEWINKKLRVRKEIREKTGYEGQILFNKHHLSHAASAFFVSPFDEAAILTIDGVGEWTTTQISKGENNKINPLKKIEFPHSLGLLYSTVTSFLGFMVNNDEYKVMGLASYGKPEYYDNFRDKIIDIKNNGSFKLNMKYFSFRESKKMWSEEFENEFGDPRKEDGKITKRHENMAATLQKITEDVVLKLSKKARKLTNSKNLCMSGGVALNSACNGNLKKKSPFENIWIQPAATDAGDSLGAAFYLQHQILDEKRSYRMKDVFLGPSFNNQEIEKILNEGGADYIRLGDDDLIEKAAELVSENEVVSWFQGRMEWGPRALGNRSILANPKNENMVDIINKKVKHREEFRPFAPSVLEDKANKYFDIDYESPYMLFVFDVKDSKKDEIPAVTHVNGTSRVQTVKRKMDSRYYNLINKFGEKTGTPVVLNTSFNVKGEPIVCTPKDAYKCFKKTGIDYLLMGNFLVK